MNGVDIVYWTVGKGILATATRAVVRIRSYGTERLPREGGCVVAVNHAAFIDVPILGAVCPRRIAYVAKTELFDYPGFSQLIRAHGTIAVRRGESDRDALRRMRETVRDGGVLGLFVEGTRQHSGEPGEAKPGAAMVAIQEGVPVVPVAIHSSADWKASRRSPVSLAWGEPMRFADLPRGSKGYQAATREIEAEIRRLWEWLGRMEELGLPRDATPPQAREDPLTRVTDAPLLGAVAVVGFPNVGKSTLVNRLTATREAVVFETPGVTRDRKDVVCEWAGKRFVLVDTGGVDIADDSPLTKQVAEQARRAVEEADLVVFVVDAKAGVTPGDEEVADILRRSGKPVLVVANKIDDPSRDDEAVEFHRLGLGDPLPISALHGYGTGDLLDLVVEGLPGEGPPEVDGDAIRVAVLGRPNVGKSSLVNAIVGRGARDRLRPAGNDARRDRHRASPRRHDLRPRGHGRHAPQAPPPAGDRVLLRAAYDQGGRARRRGARARGRERGARRPGSRRGRRGAHRRGRDARRPLEVGCCVGGDRGRPPTNREAPAPAPAGGGGLRNHGPRRRQGPRPRRGALRQAHGARLDRRAEPDHPGVA